MPRRRHSAEEEKEDLSPKRRRYNLRDTAYRRRRRRLLGGDQEGRKPVLTDKEFLEKNKVLKVNKKPGKSLNLAKIIPAKTNRKEHHTKEYEHGGIILRRGQKFTFDVIFDRKISQEHDEVTLQFTLGEQPLESKGTIIRITLNLAENASSSKDKTNDWAAQVGGINESTVTCSVTSAADSSIGTYRLFTDTRIKGDDSDDGRCISEYTERKIVILFNPWCKDDVVYMEKEEERAEYVCNETGKIWIGGRYNKYGRPWNFGQFDEPVLDVVLNLLDQGELTDVALSSPVSVIRCLSALTNSMDEEGVLEGRWTKEYPKPSTKPWEWTGSVPILEEYHKKGKSVQYGQCWVFSGVVTTLCRALGIPTRSVTNFDSAHDCDCSMTIDKHYYEDGVPEEDLDDSVWNFHVWNESWFRRLDLPDGYDGWQVHDATPQEMSEGVMRCGPAPLKAVKEGHVYLNYDVGFVFAEVNGDRVKWMVKRDGTMEVMDIEHYSVGGYISTKAVGSGDRLDLTDLYKYPEFTDDERRVTKFVNRFSTRRKHNIYNLSYKKEVEFAITTPDDTLIGDDFTVGFVVKNKVDEKRKIRVKATLVNAFYTGVCGKRVKIETFDEELDANEEKSLTMSVSLKEYKEQMNPQGQFQLFVSGKNLETGRLHASETSFFLKKPEISIEIPEKLDLGEETKATIKFVNNTQLTLTNAVLAVEGSRLLKAKTIKIKNDIKPNQEVKETIIVKPTRRSWRELIVTFTTDQIADITGSRDVFVERSSDSDSDDE